MSRLLGVLKSSPQAKCAAVAAVPVCVLCMCMCVCVRCVYVYVFRARVYAAERASIVFPLKYEQVNIPEPTSSSLQRVSQESQNVPWAEVHVVEEDDAIEWLFFGGAVGAWGRMSERVVGLLHSS